MRLDELVDGGARGAAADGRGPARIQVAGAVLV